MKSSPVTSFSCQGLTCRLVRSSRRTVGISVSADRVVTVRAPQKFPLKLALQAVMQHMAWIQKRLAAYAAAAENPLATGTSVTLMGRPFRLEQAEEAGFTDDTLLLPKNEPNPKRAIAAACRLLAKEAFSQRVSHFAPLLGIASEKLGKITISGVNCRWGSCQAAGGDLEFTWKALFCSSRDLDYLTVHELCHIKYFDHSRSFWQAVESLIPDWRECRERMREVSRQLAVQGWRPTQ